MATAGHHSSRHRGTRAAVARGVSSHVLTDALGLDVFSSGMLPGCPSTGLTFVWLNVTVTTGSSLQAMLPMFIHQPVVKA
ncbi:hypothetical protein [Paenibacillus sp. JJ778]|uniref:hypothetical protein n=1 Tax=Paenibacillus sp. JJ778 TaxID=3435411 RepID=UPI003D9CA3CD